MRHHEGGSFMGMDYEKALEARQSFIDDCLKYDTPRLQTEEYPSDVTVIADLKYRQDGDEWNEYDIYLPKGRSVENGLGDKAFILIHGGAFVYGAKNLDRRYGMYLAKKSGLPVFNINYHLLPDNTIRGVLSEIMDAAEHINTKYGIKDLRTTGDSAGGYLALMTMLLLRNPVLRGELGFKEDLDVTCNSAGLICGAYTVDKEDFPGIFFEKEGSGEDQLPDYVYDLRKLVRRFGAAKSVIVTGDLDFLREENRNMSRLFEEENIPVRFVDAISTKEHQFYHVFPISNPTWEESAELIGMIAEDADN